MLGLDVRFWHDHGAYTPYGLIVPIITSTQLLGPYKPGAYHVQFDSLYTNTVIVTPYRGAGRPQGCFVMERTMDAIAAYLGKDRTEVRATNFIQPDEFPYEHGLVFQDGRELTYDSGDYWINGDYRKESDLNRDFCTEVIDRYGHRAAFAGWYISHEINTFNAGMMRVYDELSQHLRALKDVPILMSPYVKGVKQFGTEAISLDQHVKEWEAVFRDLEGKVDIVAFQDGQMSFLELPDYMKVNRDLARKHGLQCWSNLESFDRDMPIKFPPTDIRKLLYKAEQASAAGVDKLITFEFSHFMSPHSIYPAAHHLYSRYQEWLRGEEL